MQSNFSPSSGLQSAESRTPGYNVGDAAPKSPESTLALVTSSVDPAYHHDLEFRKKSDGLDVKTRFKILNVSACVEGGGVHPHLAIDAGVPEQKLDLETQTYETVMRRTTSTNEVGEVCYSGFHISACQFFEDYEPDFQTNRITRSEWAEILGAMEPMLARGKEFSAIGAKQRADESSKIKQAMDAKQNPHGALAAGIAAGVAEALAALGITPKKKAGA